MEKTHGNKIIKLIIGLIKNESGKILIDGNDLSKLNLNDFYEYITYISQESPIFDGTLRENLILDKKIKLKNGNISMVAPTILKYMDIALPKEMKDNFKKHIIMHFGNSSLAV